MTAPNQLDAIDIPFQVPFVHRLRFTEDLWGSEARVLIDLLEPSSGLPARVQFWLDQQVDAAWPDLQPSIQRLARTAGSRWQLAGPLQVVPGGEAAKNDIQLFERMLKSMHAAKLDRRGYVVVVGGGAVLDAVGLAAAVAHRGMRLIRIPTTTLAQADSGIGVKNCVNLFQQKNWAGTFAVPWGVINDAGMLATLSDRDFRCGFAEAVKVAALKDAGFFEQLERSASAIRNRDAIPAAHAIRVSARLHLDHITRGGDPFEMNEARPLDFGHWLAHRLEVLSRFRLRHGEAVAIGVAIDTIYSALVHGLPERSMSRILDCLVRLGFHLPDPQLADPAAILEGLEEFRRHLGGRLTLTLLREIGQPVDVHEVDQEQMVRAVRLIAEKSWASDNRSATPSGSWMTPQAEPANKAEHSK